MIGSVWGLPAVGAVLAVLLFLLLCVTGIYAEYQRTTSVFVPLPPLRLG